MVEKKLTPEEKLFAVIQGADIQGPRRKAKSVSSMGMGARAKAAIVAIDIPFINRALSALMAVMAAWVAFSAIIMRPRLGLILNRAQQQLARFVIAEPLEGLAPMQASVDLIRKQDPFGLRAKARPAPASPAPSAREPSAQEKVKDLKLVGISWGAEPVAMIEHTNSGETDFLKVGDIIGQAKVHEILEDRVILRVDDEDVELF